MIRQLLGFSNLAPFRPGHDPRPALDEIAALGGNCVRTFCGPLPWASQTRESVYDGLGDYLQACSDRGLNSYLSYCTEAGTGYDLALHVGEVESIAAHFHKVVLREVANEPWHPSQGGRLSPERCAGLSTFLPGPRSYGAAEDDESDVYSAGDFVAVHLDRGRPRWEGIRRVRELLAVSESTGKPAFNQEPLGAAEEAISGKRENDPAIFLCLGALNRLFLGGSGVFHSEDGLWARPLGPVQKRCADAVLLGSQLWPGAHRLSYRNTGHAGSPAKAANFDRVVRLYFGLENDAEAFFVAVGLAGATLSDAAVDWNEGWHVDSVRVQMIGTDGRSVVAGRCVR